MTLNQDGLQKQSKQCNKIEGVVPNSVLIFCLFVCLFVSLFAFCLTAGQGYQTLVKHPPPPPPLPYTPRVEVVLPSMKFNPAWVRHFLLTNIERTTSRKVLLSFKR